MPGRLTAYSPFRVSFAGGGTDISPFVDSYGSALINTTIGRGVTVRYVDDPYPVEVSSRDFLISSVPGSSGRGKRHIGKQLVELIRRFGITTGKFLINSDVPPGSGLGSSSALITALVKIIDTIRGSSGGSSALAESSFKIERDFMGIMLGKQDPYAIAKGGFKFMEFGGDNVSVSYFSPDNAVLKYIDAHSLIIYTGKSRESSKVLRAQVGAVSQRSTQVIETLLRIKQISFEMKSAVENEDLDGFIDLVNRGWEEKKKLSPIVTNERIDGIIKEGFRSGAVAARLLGGGSEGFIFMLSGEDELFNLQSDMMKHSKFVVRISIDHRGTRLVPGVHNGE